MNLVIWIASILAAGLAVRLIFQALGVHREPSPLVGYCHCCGMPILEGDKSISLPDGVFYCSRLCEVIGGKREAS